MLKQLLSISIAFSTLLAGVCTSNIAHGYSFDDHKALSHAAEVGCKHCEEIKEQELNCCDRHQEYSKQLAVLRPTGTKTSPNPQAKIFHPRANISIAKDEKKYQNWAKKNKVPPQLQLSLPKLE